MGAGCGLLGRQTLGEPRGGSRAGSLPGKPSRTYRCGGQRRGGGRGAVQPAVGIGGRAPGLCVAQWPPDRGGHRPQRAGAGAKLWSYLPVDGGCELAGKLHSGLILGGGAVPTETWGKSVMTGATCSATRTLRQTPWPCVSGGSLAAWRLAWAQLWPGSDGGGRLPMGGGQTHLPLTRFTGRLAPSPRKACPALLPSAPPTLTAADPFLPPSLPPQQP